MLSETDNEANRSILIEKNINPQATQDFTVSRLLSTINYSPGILRQLENKYYIRLK